MGEAKRSMILVDVEIKKREQNVIGAGNRKRKKL